MSTADEGVDAGAGGAALAAVLVSSSVYYHTCSLVYRQPLRPDQLRRRGSVYFSQVLWDEQRRMGIDEEKQALETQSRDVQTLQTCCQAGDMLSTASIILAGDTARGTAVQEASSSRKLAAAPLSTRRMMEIQMPDERLEQGRVRACHALHQGRQVALPTGPSMFCRGSFPGGRNSLEAM
eukprot:763231-Hanusia_phi.AAC.1